MLSAKAWTLTILCSSEAHAQKKPGFPGGIARMWSLGRSCILDLWKSVLKGDVGPWLWSLISALSGEEAEAGGSQVQGWP